MVGRSSRRFNGMTRERDHRTAGSPGPGCTPGPPGAGRPPPTSDPGGHSPPMVRRGRAAEDDGGSGSAASPSRTAPSHRYRSGTPRLGAQRVLTPGNCRGTRRRAPVGRAEQQRHDRETRRRRTSTAPPTRPPGRPGAPCRAPGSGPGRRRGRRTAAPPPGPGTARKAPRNRPARPGRWWHPSSARSRPSPSRTTNSRPWVLPADGARRAAATSRSTTPGSGGRPVKFLVIRRRPTASLSSMSPPPGERYRAVPDAGRAPLVVDGRGGGAAEEEPGARGGGGAGGAAGEAEPGGQPGRRSGGGGGVPVARREC